MQPQMMDGEIREFYALNLNFTTAIPAGASATAYGQVDTSGDFFIQNVRATAYLSAASGGAVIGSPAATGGSPTIASNTFMTLAHFRLQLEVSAVQWFSDPMRLNHLAGDAGNPYFFQTLPALAQQAQLLGTLYNDSAQSVLAQVTFFGYKRFFRS